MSDAAIDGKALRDQARFLREETVRLIAIAKTGHFASSFSCAEILAVLYGDTLRLRRGDPDWPGRDRFLLGKGHAAVALYPLLAGLDFFPAEQLDTYTRLGSPFGDHPDMRRIPGVDFSSGSLGHALSAGKAAGFARASISFLIGNEAAERSYAKAGFGFAEEKRDRAFEALTGAPGFRRFERAI